MKSDLAETSTNHSRVIESGPQVTLYANRSEESQRAFEALEKSGISFRVVPSPRRRQPVAEFGPDRARGLADIDNLIDALRAFGDTLIEETKKWQPDFFDAADPEVIRHWQNVRQTELEEARAAMCELQASSLTSHRRR